MGVVHNDRSRDFNTIADYMQGVQTLALKGPVNITLSHFHIAKVKKQVLHMRLTVDSYALNNQSSQ